MKISNEQLKEILDKHLLWLKSEKYGVRANLSGSYLSRANLIGANLSGADIRGANLRGANLSGADLSGADLSGADLSGADLIGAYLSGSHLSRANLIGAYLSGADLIGANLSRAYLSKADLSGADLSGADLSGADLIGANLIVSCLSRANLIGANLSGAYLSNANLSNADLKDAKIDFPIACPEKGDFVGFKKANDCIVELRILSDSKRSSATTRKCRCSKAMVMSITKVDGSEYDLKEVCSTYDPSFIYRVGEIVEVDNFDENRWNVCAPGIHFFMSRDEAVNYII